MQLSFCLDFFLFQKEDVANAEMAERLSLRKNRFMHFASLEYEGEYYMTPRDFLFSVTFDQVERVISKLGCAVLTCPLPTNRQKAFSLESGKSEVTGSGEDLPCLVLKVHPLEKKRHAGKSSAKKLTKKEVDAALLCVTKVKPGPTFFRELGDKVLDTVCEEGSKFYCNTNRLYPHNGHINSLGSTLALKLMQRIIGKEDDLKTAGDETIFQEAELESCDVNTMLLVHFFGKEGKEKLRYSEFFRFMENLQTEVQEMEFIQFSKGLNVMRKEDFAEWLLYFTDEENNEIYWQNVKDRFEAGENISLEEFKTFCKFTNNLEDFSIAMQMFTVANRPVKRAEFKRAVKVATGQELSDNVLDTIFKIFDLDGDDCLSHGEFLGVLKKRIHRGLRVPQQQGIQGYWKCVKRESIKGAKELWKQSGKSPF
ncbi:UNVERIFIED_CONTAM: hypothetical protein H355_001589 [Colinus virginianus]|nr:hypothetical protein H355_001589 [Colinus virginianus]